MFLIIHVNPYQHQPLESQHISHHRFRLKLFYFTVCACGNPLFCDSTEYIQQRTDPNTSYFTIKSISDLSFCLKTRAVLSCLSTCDCSGINNCCILSQAGLHVKVINKFGSPCWRTYAIAS
ncbi:hypothetical protein TNCT_108491 [Trichonephila clavata]|uniref:Uncharacterized protein n=1 Tax=Trichonephila clavata TaxID=2740835 RepID=A0A8X6FS68_TRICU|nr:hypothetical protein TNCT_108491 [Trichonephila clavata]